MPIDMAAEVTANRPLSADYNVLALAAPAIAATSAPGQFVMVKPDRRNDPLLRRPFSVFEILRTTAPDGAAADRSSRSSTNASAHDGPRSSTTRSRTDRRVPGTARPPVHARRRSGGGVDGGRRRRTGAVCHARRGAACTRVQEHAVLRRALATELFYLDWSSRPRRRARPHHRGRQRGERGRVIVTARAAAAAARDRPSSILRVRPRRHARGGTADRRQTRPPVSGVGRAHDGVRHGRLLQLRHPAARARGHHHVRSCLAGPVLAADQIAGTDGPDPIRSSDR